MSKQTVTIFLRVPPEVKHILEAQVQGINKDRTWGTPEATLTSVVLACINQVYMPDGSGDGGKKPRGKAKVSK